MKKFLKAIASIIFNPIGAALQIKNSDKAAKFFGSYVFIVFLALLVTAVVFYLTYWFNK